MKLSIEESKPLHVKTDTVLIGAKLSSGIVINDVQAIPYSGEYEFTPSAEAQTIPTSGLLLNDNITINPIPQNYGLITWNGSFLTVS